MADDGRHPALPVPILLVTGALGAGKTTVINALLNAEHGLRLAVVVNDFGAINIDETILSATGQPIYGLKNGCICCSLQGDLLRTLRAILSLGDTPDAIVLEASGVSDPRGIIEALFDPVLAEAVRLDAVVTVVDAGGCDTDDDLWRVQVRAADFVLLAKAESAAVADLAALRALLSDLHKSVVFEVDADGHVPLELLFDHKRPRGAFPAADDLALITHHRFARLEWSSMAPISLKKFQSVIQSLAPRIVRAKGILSVAEQPGQCLIFQLAGRRASLTRAKSVTPGTQLVLIGLADAFDVQQALAELDALKS